MDSVEQMLSTGSSYSKDIQRSLQNIVNTITSREVLPELKSPKLDKLAKDLTKLINNVDFNMSVMADNKMNHTNINTMSRDNISEPGNAVNQMNQVNDGLSASYNNKVSGSKTESTEIVTKKLKNIQL